MKEPNGIRWVPTPKQIKRACERARKKWSPARRRNRGSVATEDYRPNPIPGVDVYLAQPSDREFVWGADEAED